MNAFWVASGIFLSRIAGLVRDRVFAHYFGNSEAADAFRAAFRIPNFLQNLFGEGVLSASFIPVYAKLEAQGRHKEAQEVAGAVAGIFSLIISILVLAGIFAAPILISIIAPGFTGEKKELCILLVKIFFPGAGMLVFSAWCLGILNSHGKFLLSYTAPVLWNIAIITSLIVFGNASEFKLAEWAAWGSVTGSAIQVLVQFPIALHLLKKLKLSLNIRLVNVRKVIRNFIPVFIGRGVVQISAYVDSLLASLLPTGAVSALSYAQTLYLLPVSLFGMSVSASELPALSRAVGNEKEVAQEFRKRIENGIRQIAFFIVPSVVALLTLGDVIAAAIYQTGRFTHDDAIYVWGVLAGSTVGLLASTMGRLYASAFYALHDTRTPLKFAFIRVLLTSALGYIAALYLPAMFGVNEKWGVAGLTASAGISGWLEFALLRSRLNQRIGKTGIAARYMLSLWIAAAAASGSAWLVKLLTGIHQPVLNAIFVLGTYGIIYFFITFALRIPEAQKIKQFVKLPGKHK
jgi:putative peptidoglycan lipid II flippase